MSTNLPPTKPPAEVHPMQALLDQGGYDMPQRGDIREGTVISVSAQEVIIDLGVKREGIVPANDLSRLDKETLAEVLEGTTWPVYILQPSDREGNLIVSLSRALQEKDWLVAQQMLEKNEMFEAEVSGYNAGGLEVIFGKLRGFVPASHISTLPRTASPDERKAQLAAYVGRNIPLKVVEVDRRRRRLIMSERAAHRRWQREHRKQLLDDLQVGDVRDGVVRSLANFGVFIDLGGADGLVHISELAWFPVTHPSEVLKVGQEVQVKVLRVDKPRERIGLSIKRVQPDPWTHAEEDYHVAELVEAVVTRVTDFGAFVRLRTGVEGLLHVSEMADIRPDHPQSLVAPGDLLLLRVLRIEPDRRRIGLSLRQVSETEWSEWAASYREKHAIAAAQAQAEAEAQIEAEHELESEAGPELEAELEFAPPAEELESEAGELEEEAAELESEAVDLEVEAAVLEAQAAELKAEAAELEGAAAELEAEADELEVEAADLEEEAEVVESLFASVEPEPTSLEVEAEQLETEIDEVEDSEARHAAAEAAAEPPAEPTTISIEPEA